MAEMQTPTDHDPGDQKGKRDPITEHPKWKLVVQGLGAVAALGAVLYLIVPGLFPTKPSPAPGPGGTSSVNPTSTASPTAPTAGSGQTEGPSCLASEFERV